MREAVAHLCREHEVSQRRAYSVSGADRSSMHYQGVRPNNTESHKAMKALAVERSSIDGAIGSSRMDDGLAIYACR